MHLIITTRRGFLTATPFGDIADCLLSDAPRWLLQQYPVLIVAGELKGGAEVKEKLENYVRLGGHLVLTSGNIEHLPDGIFDWNKTGPIKNLSERISCLLSESKRSLKMKSFKLQNYLSR